MNKNAILEKIEKGELQTLHETYVSKLKLVESNDSNINNSVEEKSDTPVLGSVEGPFAEIEEVNRNNRIYSKPLWEKVIDSGYVQEMMENKTLLGEGDHPDDRFEISIPKVSHCVTDLWINEKDGLLMGRADILDTPVGNIVYALVEYGSKVGISARAAGSLEEDGDILRVVEDDYQFFTFDFVPNPGFAKTRLDEAGSSEDNNSTSNQNSILDNNDMLDSTNLKESLMEKIEDVKEENLAVIESIINSIAIDEENYKLLIDKIESRKNSSLENTFSQLEESHKKIFSLEKENEDLKEQVQNLQDEVNSLSEDGEKVLENSDAELYKHELKESKERINKLKGLVDSLKRQKTEKTSGVDIIEEDLKLLDEAILKLKREGKSKKLYSDLLEDRIESISEKKVALEKQDRELKETNQKLRQELKESNQKLRQELKESEESLEKLAERFVVLENYIVEQVAGRTGAKEDLVRKYIPENYNIDNISLIERKIKRDINKQNDNKFKKPVTVNESKEDSSTEKSKQLGKLVASVKNK